MTIYEKLTKIQAKLKAPKKETNNFGGYKYRTIESIYSAVKPLLEEIGCCLVITDSIEIHGDWHYVCATAQLVDNEGGLIQSKAYAREPIAKKGTSDEQITGSASTYARKYALTALFLLDNSENDPDSEEYQKKIKKNTAKEEKTVKEDPDRVAAYEDFKGICAKNDLSAAKVARDLGLHQKSSKDEFDVAIEGLTQLIDTNQDLSKWRA